MQQRRRPLAAALFPLEPARPTCRPEPLIRAHEIAVAVRIGGCLTLLHGAIRRQSAQRANPAVDRIVVPCRPSTHVTRSGVRNDANPGTPCWPPSIWR